MMITPKYCRVEWNHLHTFQPWQRHPIKSTLILIQIIHLSLVPNVSKARVLDRFRWLRARLAVRSSPSPRICNIPIPPTSKYVEWPIVTYAPHASLLFRRYYCPVASYHHTHSKSTDIICPLCPYHRPPRLSDPLHSLHPLLHTVSFLP